MAKEVFQLEVQIQTNPALAGLRGLNKELDATKKKVDDIGKGNKLGGIQKQVTGVTSAFKGLQGVITSTLLALVGGAVVKTIADFETLNTVLGTVTGSAKGAAEGMKLIQDVSRTTPFTIDQIGNTFIKLKASGIDPTRESMQLFADVASVTTDKVGALRAITDLYSRTTAGGLGLEELNRLADRGIPVFDILGKRLGVTRLQLSELGKTTEGAAIVLRNLEAGFKASFAGNAAKQMNTLNGQFDIFKKNLEGLAISAGQGGLNTGLTDLVKVLNEISVSLKPVAAVLGGVLGGALTSVANGVKYLTENWAQFLSVTGVVLGVVAAVSTVLAGPLTAAAAGATVATRVLISQGPSFVNFFKIIGLSITPVLAKLATFLTTIKGIGLTALTTLGIAGSIKGSEKSKTDPRAEFRKQEIADAEQIRDATNDQLIADRKLTEDLITGRAKILTVMLDTLRKEQAVIGKTSEEVETQNKLFDAQAAIKLRLLNAGKSEAEAEAGSQLNAAEASKIRAAVSSKFAAERRFQFQEFVKNTTFEIGLIGKSNNEIEKQTKLREYLVAQGRLEVATEEEKLKILEQITKSQEARINNSLNKNLEGIQKEIEYLKLSNKEREIRIALDQAAADAGFKNAEELIKKRPMQAGEIRSGITARYLTGIDVEGQKQIDQLKEQVTLNSILDEQERQRAKNQLDIYKAIDPDGKGENITRAQKEQLNALLATIEAQEKMLEVQKQITDQFGSLGSAVSQWVLGSKDGIKQVKLELLKLIALQAYKSFAAGNNNSLVGSFIEGVIGGISGGREKGGPVEAGKSYIVGEKRPEVFVPNTNGYIVPNTAMMNTKSGSVSNVTVAPSLIIQGSVTGQSELDRAFEQFAGAMAAETEKLIIRQTGAGGIVRAR